MPSSPASSALELPLRGPSTELFDALQPLQPLPSCRRSSGSSSLSDDAMNTILVDGEAWDEGILSIGGPAVSVKFIKKYVPAVPTVAAAGESGKGAAAAAAATGRSPSRQPPPTAAPLRVARPALLF
jgi:hypothetical protein